MPKRTLTKEERQAQYEADLPQHLAELFYCCFILLLYFITPYMIKPIEIFNGDYNYMKEQFPDSYPYNEDAPLPRYCDPYVLYNTTKDN